MEQGKNLANTILNLPSIHNSGNKSIHSLLKATGYFELHDQIPESLILEMLNDHLEFADQWIQWSDDSRATPKWYIIQNEQGKYVVDRYPKKWWGFKKRTEHIVKNEACARYIKLEIENIRGHNI